MASAIISAAALLALQRVVIIVLALFSGPLTDRLGAERLLLPCSLAVAAGLATIATGHVYFGTIVVIVSRALLATVGPVLAAQKSTDRIAALASFATWTDVGLAAGAFFGVVGIVEIGYATSYWLLAVLSAAAVLWYSRSVKPV
ncbi:hypothetical protein [Bradyrhizobium sp. URHC0002]